MKIRRGTKGPDRTPCHWIEPRIAYQWEIHDLVDGLCSEYFRNRTDDDDPLPEHLTYDEIIDTVKEQYKEHGTNNVWTWSDGGDFDENEKARAWARRLILAVLPDLEVN